MGKKQHIHTHRQETVSCVFLAKNKKKTNDDDEKWESLKQEIESIHT